MNVSATTNDAVPVVWLDRIWKSFGRLEVLTDVSQVMLNANEFVYMN